VKLVKMELLDFQVDRGQLVRRVKEVTLDHRDLTEKKVLQEIRVLSDLKANLVIKEALVLWVWWELMDHLGLR
jgi:hypothetical protein